MAPSMMILPDRYTAHDQALVSLLEDIGTFYPQDFDDRWTWSLEVDGSFSVESARVHVDDICLPSTTTPTRWFPSIPTKINIFLWPLYRDCLPSRIILTFRGNEIDTIIYPVCLVWVDARDHSFFQCHIASSIWHHISLWTN
ncbi:uncharacterized protein [Rutidosis leptorrhynchoides]|uniref:uncharacterized protein n=1 Tax=Rutidosis leptorrhynchoides TaxID=125765 RepID=UPI003A993F28